MSELADATSSEGSRYADIADHENPPLQVHGLGVEMRRAEAKEKAAELSPGGLFH